VSTAGAAPAEEEGRFPQDAGPDLAYRSWHAAHSRAALLLVHGLGEHSARYAPTARALVRQGIDVHALDLVGHGRSPGKRGHVDSFRDLVGQVLAFRNFIRTSPRAGLPLFLFGHSLGGLIALRVAQEHPEEGWRGLALSAPALGVSMAVPAWKRVLGRAVSRVAPRLTLENGIDPEHISRDPSVVQAYREDPLVHSRISARLYAEMMREMETARTRVEALATLDSLWLVPMGDRICDAEAALAVAASLPEPSRHRVVRYEGAFHEALNDLVRERVVADLSSWLLERAD
jgi:lysophospholipase